MGPGNGYRRYSKADMERLRFALTAQRDEYLPLSVIRERLAEMDEEASAPAPVAPRVVASHGRVVSGPMDLEFLVAASGATEEEVAELVSLGLVTPDHKGRFDARALRTVVLALKANRMGVPLRNLRTVRSSAERQADVIDQAVQIAYAEGKYTNEDIVSAYRYFGLNHDDPNLTEDSIIGKFYAYLSSTTQETDTRTQLWRLGDSRRSERIRARTRGSMHLAVN